MQFLIILILILLIFLFVTYKTKNSNIDINHEKTKSNISQIFFFLIVGLAALIGGSHFAVSNAARLPRKQTYSRTNIFAAKK